MDHTSQTLTFGSAIRSVASIWPAGADVVVMIRSGANEISA